MRRLRAFKVTPSAIVLLTVAACCWFLWLLNLSETAWTVALQTQDNEQSSDRNLVSFRSPSCGCLRNGSSDTLRTNRRHTWDWCGPESTKRGPHQKVVAFSIFGEADNKEMRYFKFLRDNAVAVNKVLPGWTMRLYHKFEKESAEHKFLCQVYCDIPWMDLCDLAALERSLSKREKNRKKPDRRPVTGEQISHLDVRMWRFLPMLDPLVDIFIPRDLDSMIIHREVVALHQWLESNYTFHVMRDHQGHTKKMLGGLFGVKIFQRRDLVEGLTRILIGYGQTQQYGLDQSLLAKIVWPIAKHDVMAHDSYHCMEHWNALPTFPFLTKRDNFTFVSGNLEGRWDDPIKCPVACRPPDHQEWEYC